VLARRIALASVLLIGATVACVLPRRTVVYPGNDPRIVKPALIHEVRPEYSQTAMDAKIQGSVLFTAVVRPDGTVDDIRVVKSLDSEYGLDDQARLALSQWRFNPGTLNGKPVPVLVHVELTYTLR
jgi:TonB family protein